MKRNFFLVLLTAIAILGMSNLGNVLADEPLPPELPVVELPTEEPTEEPEPVLEMTTAQLCELLGILPENCTAETLDAAGVNITFPDLTDTEWMESENLTWRGDYGKTESVVLLPTDTDGDGATDTDIPTTIVTNDLVIFEVVNPAQGNTYLVQVLLPNGKVNQHPVSQNNALKYLTKHDASFSDTTVVVIPGGTLPEVQITEATDAQTANSDSGNQDKGKSTDPLPEQSNAGNTPAADHNPHITPIDSGNEDAGSGGTGPAGSVTGDGLNPGGNECKGNGCDKPKGKP